MHGNRCRKHRCRHGKRDAQRRFAVQKDTVGHESARNAGCGETAAVIAGISGPAI